MTKEVKVDEVIKSIEGKEVTKVELDDNLIYFWTSKHDGFYVEVIGEDMILGHIYNKDTDVSLH